MPRARHRFWIVRAWGATDIQRRTRFNAASTGENAASSIGMRGPVGAVRRNSSWSWQLPPTNVSTPLQFRNLNSETSVRVPPLPTTDHEQMFQSEGTFPVPSVLVSDSRGSLEIDHGRGWSVWGRVTPMPGGAHNQRSNQAQEFLLLRSVASCDEKGSDLNVGDLST